MSSASSPSQGTRPYGYQVEPSSGSGPGVLVLHAWWGLNEDVKAYCHRLAKQGFFAFAPDLFHGQTAVTVEEAEALVQVQQTRYVEIQSGIRKAAEFLVERSGHDKIAVVGFSFGAYYALWYSNAEPAEVWKAVVYYGTGHEDFSQSQASYLGHFAEQDDFEPKESVDNLTQLLQDAGRPATIHTYPGTGHWFAEPGVTQAYNSEAAELAWERTLQFLSG